jgi:hypothetical protein
MKAVATESVTTLPFGRFKGAALTAVDSGYLRWLVRETKLSSGLQAAVVAELARRGEQAPPGPPPKPEPRCPQHPAAPLRHRWTEFRDGRKQIRRTCSACGHWMGFSPLVEPYLSLANEAASPTALLDVLTQAGELGVHLKVVNGAAEFASTDDWKRATPELRDRLRECRKLLGGMLWVRDTTTA